MARPLPLKLIGGLMAIVFFISSTGCATLINGTMQEVTVTSNPSEANVSVEGLQLKTPAKVNVSRKSAHTMKFEKEGYEPKVEEIERYPSWWNLIDALWLILFFIPLLTDLGSGGFYTFDDQVHVNLNKTAPPATSTAP